jgi:Kef-type K+ transport system membrane component KefB
MTDAMNLSLLTGRFLEDSATEDGSHDDHFGVHIEFSDLYAANMFLAAIYVTGFSFSRYLAMPAMVGEILIGVLLGPGLANIVPLPEAFVLLGEIGLILLVLEAGIDVDLTMLRLVGARGVLIAVVGTVLPIALAFVVAQVLGYSGVTAIAAACCFGPTSVGIAMNILRRSHMVNTPVGQLIITAAIIDDMIARK